MLQTFSFWTLNLWNLQWRKPQIFQTLASGCGDIEIRKLDFVSNNHVLFPNCENRKRTFLSIFKSLKWSSVDLFVISFVEIFFYCIHFVVQIENILNSLKKCHKTDLCTKMYGFLPNIFMPVWSKSFTILLNVHYFFTNT